MTIDHSKLTLYFHLINHYKKLKNVKAKVDCSCPKGYPRTCECKPVKLTTGTPHLHSLLTTPRDYNRTTPTNLRKQCSLKHRERSCSCPPRKLQKRKDCGSTHITSLIDSEICKTFSPSQDAKYVEKGTNGKNSKKNTSDMNKVSIECSKKQINSKQENIEIGKPLLRTNSLITATACIELPGCIKSGTQTAAFDCIELEKLPNDSRLSPQRTNEEIKEATPAACKCTDTVRIHTEKAEKSTQFRNESIEEIKLLSVRSEEIEKSCDDIVEYQNTDYTDNCNNNKNNKFSETSINTGVKDKFPKAPQCAENEMPVEKFTSNVMDLCSSPDDNALLDYEYTTFLLRITEDILRNNMYGSNTDIENLFDSHIEANKNHLNEQKMKDKIEQLKRDLNYPFKFTASVSSKGKMAADNMVSVSSCSCIDDIHHLKNNCDFTEAQEGYKNLKCIDIQKTEKSITGNVYEEQYSKAQSVSSELIIIEQDLREKEEEIISNKINLSTDCNDSKICSSFFGESEVDKLDTLFEQKEVLKKNNNNKVKMYDEILGDTEISEIITYNNCHCSIGFQKTALKINPLSTTHNDEYILIDGPVCLPKTMLKEQTISVLIQNVPSDELSSNTSLEIPEADESKRNLLQAEDPPSVDKNVKMFSISSVLEKEMLSSSDYDLTPEKETFPEKEEIERLEEILEITSKTFDVPQQGVYGSKQCNLMKCSTQPAEEIWRFQKKVEEEQPVENQDRDEMIQTSESKACSATTLDIQTNLKNCKLDNCPTKNSSNYILKKVLSDKKEFEPLQPDKTCDLTKCTAQNYNSFQITGDTKMLDISDYRKQISSDEIMNRHSNSSQAFTFFDDSPSTFKSSDVANKYHYLLQDAATSISSSDFLLNYKSRMTGVPMGMQTKVLSFNDQINLVNKDDTLLIEDYYTVKTTENWEIQPNAEPKLQAEKKPYEQVAALKKQVSTFQTEPSGQITATSKKVSHESEIISSAKKKFAEPAVLEQFLQAGSFEEQASSSTISESSQHVGERLVPISPSVSEPPSRLDSISSTRENLKFKLSNSSIKQTDNTNKSVQDDISTASMVTDRLKQFRNVDFGDNSNRRFQISNPDQFEIRRMDEKKKNEEDEEEDEERKKPRRIKPVCCGIVQSSKHKKK